MVSRRIVIDVSRELRSRTNVMSGQALDRSVLPRKIEPGETSQSWSSRNWGQILARRIQSMSTMTRGSSAFSLASMLRVWFWKASRIQTSLLAMARCAPSQRSPLARSSQSVVWSCLPIWQAIFTSTSPVFSDSRLYRMKETSSSAERRRARERTTCTPTTNCGNA